MRGMKPVGSLHLRKRQSTAASQDASRSTERIPSRMPNASSEFKVATVPKGFGENSPAFQRWVVRFPRHRFPEARTKNVFQREFRPSLRDLSAFARQLSVETLGYSRPSLRDKPASGIPRPIGASETRALACNKSRNCPTRRNLSNSARSSAVTSPLLFASNNCRIRSRALSLKRNERKHRAASAGSPGRSGATTSFKMSASVSAGGLMRRICPANQLWQN